MKLPIIYLNCKLPARLTNFLLLALSHFAIFFGWFVCVCVLPMCFPRPLGGWVAPNIYYLGYSGIVRYNGIVIGGLSGIYKQHDFRLGHYETVPFNASDMRSVYHIREFEVFKLLQYTGEIDIMLSHDWPRGIANYGNKSLLCSKKKFLKEEIDNESLGSPPAEKLLFALQPKYWFSAHLHVKFPAVVTHEQGNTTKFLALDKCLPHRDYMQVLDFPQRPPCTSNTLLCYDPVWLSIVKSTTALMNVSRNTVSMPRDNSQGIK